MPRFLALDWDQQELHIVSGVSGRGGVRVDQAFTWTLPEPLTTATDEALGRKLAQVLKEAGIAPAPVIACVGRERVIVKELRIPPVDEKDEPGLVRFQAVKELTEPADEVFIDYARTNHSRESGERQVLAVIVRREVVHCLRGLCRGLGRKLLAVAPRSAGVTAALQRTTGGDAEASSQTRAVLTMGKQWADLAILRDGQLQFTRSLPTAGNLTGEVKRSLAIYSAQFGDGVKSLYVAGGDGASLLSSLHEASVLPTHELNPFVEDDAVRVAANQRGAYAGAIGLLHQWAVQSSLPVNFVAPKEPRPVRAGPGRPLLYLAGAVAAGLIFLFVAGQMVLSSKKALLRDLAEEKNALEKQLKDLAQDRADMDALKDWDQTTISWLDEIYDLAARFPHQQGVRITSFSAGTPTKRNPKEKYVGKVTITGTAPPEKEGLVIQFVDALNHDPHLRATFERSTGKGDFILKVDIMKQPADKYTTKLTPPPRPKVLAPPPMDAAEEDDAEGGQP